MTMPKQSLQGCRILIVEDEYLIAEVLSYDLEDAGAVVVGPVGSVAAALDLIHSESCIDAAVLDMNLQGERAYPVADLLMARSVPFLFTTGYDSKQVPPPYESVPRCEKPMTGDKVIETIKGLIQPNG